MYDKKVYLAICIILLLATALSAPAQDENSSGKIDKVKDAAANIELLAHLGIGIDPVEVIPENPTAADQISLHISGTAGGCSPANPVTRIYDGYIRIETAFPTDPCTTEIKSWKHKISLGELVAGDYDISLSFKTNTETIEISGYKISIKQGLIPTAKIETIPEFPKAGETVKLKVSGMAKAECMPENPQLKIDDNRITFSSKTGGNPADCANSSNPEVAWEYEFPLEYLWQDYYRVRAVYFASETFGVMAEYTFVVTSEDPATDPPEPEDEPMEEPQTN